MVESGGYAYCSRGASPIMEKVTEIVLLGLSLGASPPATSAPSVEWFC